MNNANHSSEVVHPGEKIGDFLKFAGMSQRELALRTGFSEKHVSTVISGNKDISLAFAKQVERALGLSANELMANQVLYDVKKFEEEERNQILPDEFQILKRLKGVALYLIKHNLLRETADDIDAIVALRDFMGVCNLCKVTEIPYNAAYRAQVRNNGRVDPYILFAWQQMCEQITKDIKVSAHLDIELLRANLPAIKRVMFTDENKVELELQRIFSECGIAFRIVANFTGAPVQGFIKEARNGRLILCMTTRQKRQDIFWFTLFHEVAHIFYGDVKHRFVDFDVKSDAEARADEFSGNVLLPSEAYREFVMDYNFTKASIIRFAERLGVPEHIVYGRLLRDEYLTYNRNTVKHLPKYQILDTA